MHGGRFEPVKKSRVVTGKSWVDHGFVTGLKKPGFSLKTRFFFEISRVATGRSWVCHVNHGLRQGVLNRPDFSPSNFEKKHNHEFLFTVPCKSRDLLGRSLGNCYKQGQKRVNLGIY